MGVRLATVSCAMAVAVGFGGAASLSAPQGRGAADEAWAQLRARGRAPDVPATADEAGREMARVNQKAHFNQLANDAAKFARDHREHPKAAEAKHLEAKARLSASLLDKDPVAKSVLDLADEVRADQRLPVAARFEVAALAELAAARKFKDRAAWLDGREQGARKLIAGFPTEPGGHAFLLEVAGRHEGAKAAALAREVAESSAPASLKAAAQSLLARQALLGRPWPEALAGMIGAERFVAAAKDRPVLIYTWSPDAPGSVLFAQELARLAPAGAAVFGVQVAPDPVLAAQVAARYSLPGEQIHGGRDFAHPLLRQLRLNGLGQVCLVGRDGLIRALGAPGNLREQLKGP